MRRLALVALLAACGDRGLPAPPSKEAFEAADDVERCRLTEPRGARCAHELILEAARSIDESGELVQEIERRGTPHHVKEERGVYRSVCHGGFGVAEAVLVCWDEPDCRAFVRCVTARTSVSDPVDHGPP